MAPIAPSLPVDLAGALLEARRDAVLVLDAHGHVERANEVARGLVAADVGVRPALHVDRQGRERPLDPGGAVLLLDVVRTPLEDGRTLLSLLEPRERHARVLEEMSEVLLTGRREEPILEALAAVTGRTLDLDRSLIYEARFDTGEAAALCEWLNPEIDVAPTRGVYPLETFGAAARWLREHRTCLVSHRDAPHPAMLEDGSAELLHGAMAIQSLLWVPFGFREQRFFGLVFNQVTTKRAWLPAELAHLQVATSQVTLALRQVAWTEERARTERALAEAQRHESVGLLAAGVAHDLGGHLGIVLGSLDRAAHALPDASPVRALLRGAETAALEASSLAKHLLAYAGKGQFVVEPLDLGALVVGMQDLLRAAVGRVRLVIRAEATWVAGDATQLRQVVMNLVVNGAQAIEDGAGTVTVAVSSSTDGEVAARSAVGRVAVLEVTDTGVGMTGDVAARALDPFFSTKGAGRGLGLPAAAGIVRAHGGEVHVRTAPGAGSTFTITLPVVAPAAAPPPAPSGAEVETGTVLVADDVRPLREVTRGLLRDAGFDVESAPDGATALAALEANPGIDVLLMDWSMPGGGDALLARARALRPALPIVVTSGYAEGAVGAPRDGRTTFLEKPYRAEQLVAAIRDVLAGRAGS